MSNIARLALVALAISVAPVSALADVVTLESLDGIYTRSIDVRTSRLRFAGGQTTIDVYREVIRAHEAAGLPRLSRSLKKTRVAVVGDLERLLRQLIDCVEKGKVVKGQYVACQSVTLSLLSARILDEKKKPMPANMRWTQLHHYVGEVKRTSGAGGMNMVRAGRLLGQLGLRGFGCFTSGATRKGCQVFGLDKGPSRMALGSGEAGRTLVELPGLEGRDGSPLSLSSLRGKRVVVMFGARWCPPCLKLFEDVDRFARRGKRRDTVYLAVVLGPPKTRAAQRKAVARLGLRAVRVAYLDPTEKIEEILLGEYGAKTYPFTVVADPSGRVTARVRAYPNFRKREMPVEARLPAAITGR